MEFYMNNKKWIIKEVSQEDFWRDDDKVKEMNNSEYHFGRCKYDKQEIWLWKDISEEQMRHTLYHELLHCYRGTYVTFANIECDEDFWCDLSANSHDLIHSITEEYFARKKNKVTKEQFKEFINKMKEKDQ